MPNSQVILGLMMLRTSRQPWHTLSEDLSVRLARFGIEPKNQVAMTAGKTHLLKEHRASAPMQFSLMVTMVRN